MRALTRLKAGMGFGVGFGGDLGGLVFQNDASGTGIAALGSGLLASVTAGNLYQCLGTAAPVSPHNDATSNEITYPNYARQPSVRGTGGFDKAANVISNHSLTVWPTCGTTGATFTASHWWLTTAGSGASRVVIWGTITSPPTFGQNSAPQASAGGLTATIV